MQQISETVGERIRELLGNVGYDGVRAVIGVSRETFLSWRNGTKRPSVYQVIQILDAQNLPVSWLLDDRSASKVNAWDGSDREEKTELLRPHNLMDDTVFEAALTWHRQTHGAMRATEDLMAKLQSFSLSESDREHGVLDIIQFETGMMAVAYFGLEAALFLQNSHEIAYREFDEWAEAFYAQEYVREMPLCLDISKAVNLKHVTRMIHYRKLVLPISVEGQDGSIVIARESAPSEILSGLTLVS